ncbi:MAG: hypothetical protein HFG39_09235 [Lachnospiraceae bacterium]|nr:hypothetical protein [Lachnospiraceae bacterium]
MQFKLYTRDGDCLVYYAINDIGRWSDGRDFIRWTFLTVNYYKDDWEG